MSHTKFIENNIEKLVQIYVTESKIKQRGILLLDFRKQEEQKVNVSYVELSDVPKDIYDIIFKKINNSLYNSVAFFCILKPDNHCLLLDINLDPSRNGYFDKITEETQQETQQDTQQETQQDTN